MESVANRHALKSAQDLADVSAHTAHLPRSAIASIGDGTGTEHGAKTYAQRCASCHGDAGEGNAKSVTPKLAGQHYHYLLRQMYDGVEGRRPNLSPAHVKLLQTFVMEDFEGVANHLSRLR